MLTATLKDKVVVRNTISEEDQAILIQVRDNLRNNYFLIGDIANKYIYASVRYNYGLNVQDIYDEIGKIVGKSGRTVRYYAEEASFYTQTMRDEYDILPFSFFVFARTTGDAWKHVLDYAMEHPQYSLAAIKHHFLSDADSLDSLDEQYSDDIMVTGNMGDKPALSGQGDVVQVGPIVNMMIDLSSRAISLVNSIPIDDDKKAKLIEAITTIQEIVATMI